jgi:hypothetical protein
MGIRTCKEWPCATGDSATYFDVDVLLASKRNESAFKFEWVSLIGYFPPPQKPLCTRSRHVPPSCTGPARFPYRHCPEVETAFAGDDDYEDFANLRSFSSSVHIGDTLPAHSASILSFPLWHHRLSSRTPNPLRPPLTLARTT